MVIEFKDTGQDCLRLEMWETDAEEMLRKPALRRSDGISGHSGQKKRIPQDKY